MDSKKSLKNKRSAAPRVKDPVTQFLGKQRWKGISKKEHAEFARKHMTNWWAKQSPAARKARGMLMTAARLKKKRAKARAKKKA